jgi:hypothetical protein
MTKKRTLLAATLIAASTSTYAGELSVGTHLEAFSLTDQFDQTHAIDAQTRVLLFSRDKDLAKMAFAILDKRDANFLRDRKASLILDISAMPRLITWAIAKPRMRRHAFPLLLDAGPGPTKSLPTEDKKLTLVYLKGLEVQRVAYMSDAAALEKALDGLDR